MNFFFTFKQCFIREIFKDEICYETLFCISMIMLLWLGFVFNAVNEFLWKRDNVRGPEEEECTKVPLSL